jgi:hypothetical protein
VKVHDVIDYAGWLASDSSRWMGDELRTELLTGIAEWRVWTSWDDSHERPLVTEQLLEWLDDRHDDPAILDAVRPILAQRLDHTVKILQLPETGDKLATRLLAAGFVEKYKPRRSEKASG